MENWIGIGVWIVMGAVVGLVVRAIIKRPEEQPGHVPIIIALGSFGALIGGMLGVGLFEFFEPLSLSVGGMGGALFLSVLMTSIYRWGLRGML